MKPFFQVLDERQQDKRVMKRVPLEFNRHGGKYILMFGDRGYAERVASLNGAQVRTGTDPYTGD